MLDPVLREAAGGLSHVVYDHVGLPALSVIQFSEDRLPINCVLLSILDFFYILLHVSDFGANRGDVLGVGLDTGLHVLDSSLHGSHSFVDRLDR